ncbi:hypothetical protein NM688_g2926 [Phlebia brevispora]|uniref:Uncharacterized protein n=1 Tax=Phlebia brevispora TaxID=194682 RepID=A0ACC1T789_9APHY|nr:hypothetical protein NM688_g2926 [Phlebia brevispora]
MRLIALASSVLASVSLLTTAALPMEAREFKLDVIDTRNPDVSERSTKDDSRFTWFEEGGYGACGYMNSNSDFVVAINEDQWDNGAHCGEFITISYDGRSTTAEIVDLCPGCPDDGLDLTEGLFTYLAGDLSIGVIYGTWSYQ